MITGTIIVIMDDHRLFYYGYPEIFMSD